MEGVNQELALGRMFGWCPPEIGRTCVFRLNLHRPALPIGPHIR